MAINRYTRLTPSRFNPLTMQEIFTVPLAKQKQHDVAQSKLDELGLFDIDRLAKDDELAKSFINEYQSNIDSQVDGILESGITNRTINDIKKLALNRNKWLSNDGEGGKIVKNYKLFQDYKKQLDEALKAKTLEKDRYDALLNKSLNSYTGVKNDGKLNLETPSSKVDISKKLKPYLDSIMSNPDEIEKNTGYKYDPHTGLYINILENHKTTKEGLIEVVTNNLIKSDPEIMAYLNQRESLGFESVSKTIDDLSKTFNPIFSVNKHNQKLQVRNPIQNSNSNSNSESNKFVDNSSIYSHNSYTRNIFENNSTHESIQKTYKSLLASDKTDDDHKKGLKLKKHYERALDIFEKRFPELVSNYNTSINSDSELTNISNKLGISNNETLNLINDAKNNISYVGAETPYKTMSNKSPQETTLLKKLSKEDYLILENKSNKYRKIKEKYDTQLNDYLQNYTDNTREYLLTGLKSGENSTINRDLSNIMTSLPISNVSVYRSTKNNKIVTDFNENEKLLKSIKNGAYNTSFISYTTENENGLPSIKLKYNNSDDNGIIEIELDNINTPGSFSKNVDKYVMDQFRKYGGLEGKILASRGEDNIKYKNIIPSSSIEDTRNSNEIKHVISKNVIDKIKSQVGNIDFKLSILTTNIGNKNMYTLQVSDDNNSSSLTWDKLFNNIKDFEKVATPRLARFIGKSITEKLNKSLKDITKKDLYNYLENLIENKEVILMDNYKDLLNLLGE